MLSDILCRFNENGTDSESGRYGAFLLDNWRNRYVIIVYLFEVKHLWTLNVP